MAKDKSWWRLRQVRHRDAVILSLLAAACLLGGQLTENVANCPSPPCSIGGIYQDYIVPYLNNPPVLVLLVALALLGFTTYFGGIFVLLGGLHFSWGRVGRGRFLVGLGIGVSLIGLLSRLAQAVLVTGTPLAAIVPYTTSLTGLGILCGFVSHTLMAQYAILLKKHAKRVWRRWRKAQPEADDTPRARPP